jgi:hypothetical protein
MVSYAIKTMSIVALKKVRFVMFKLHWILKEGRVREQRQKEREKSKTAKEQKMKGKWAREQERDRREGGGRKEEGREGGRKQGQSLHKA